MLAEELAKVFPVLCTGLGIQFFPAIYLDTSMAGPQLPALPPLWVVDLLSSYLFPVRWFTDAGRKLVSRMLPVLYDFQGIFESNTACSILYR